MDAVHLHSRQINRSIALRIHKQKPASLVFRSMVLACFMTCAGRRGTEALVQSALKMPWPEWGDDGGENEDTENNESKMPHPYSCSLNAMLYHEISCSSGPIENDQHDMMFSHRELSTQCCAAARARPDDRQSPFPP